MVAVVTATGLALVVGFMLIGPALTGTRWRASTVGRSQPSSTVGDVARPMTEQPSTAEPSPLPELEATALPALEPPVAPVLSPSPTSLSTHTPIAAATLPPTAEPTLATEPSPPEPTATEQVVVAGIVVNPSRVSVSEGGDSASVILTLSTQPQGPVTFSLSTMDDACSVSTELVTLDEDTWQSGVVVDVAARDDWVASGPQTCLVATGSVSSADRDYDGLQPDDVTVTVVDDDMAGIVVAPASLSLSEPEDAGTFTVALSSQPLAEVTIPLRTSNEQCRISSYSVTLDGTNWLTGVTVTVAAIDDQVADGGQMCMVHTAAATSEGADYDQMEPEDVAVSVGDDDTAGIVVAPASLSLSEPEDAGTFTVALSSQPLAEVTIPLRTSNEQCRLSSDSVTLDSTNWVTGVAVSVEAIDDDIADGEQTCMVHTGAATSEGADYDQMELEDVAVSVGDDDVVGIVVAPASLTIGEPEDAGTFTITLGSQPLAEVTIPLSASNEQCRLSSDSVRLDSANWLTGVAVTVVAIDDQVADGEQTCMVHTGAATSEDGDYNEVEVADVTVTVSDDDVPGILVDPVSLSVTEDGAPATVTIALASRPQASVTLHLGTSNGQCSVSPESVSLDGDNWRDGVRVTVAAVNDWKADGDKVCRVRSDPAASSDASYDGLQPEAVQVAVADDDIPGILVSPTSLSLSEPEGTATLTIGLGSRPLSPVSLSLSPSSDEYSLSPDTVTLDGENWRTGVTVIVTAHDDSVAAGQRSGSISLAATSDDPQYNGLEVPGVAAVIEDDDVAGVMISPTDLVLAYGEGPVSYEIVLTSQPIGEVVIGVSSDDRTAVSPDVLTFDAGQWKLPQTVTVTAADSGDREKPLTSVIVHTIRGGDDSYTGLSISNVEVRLTGATQEAGASAGVRRPDLGQGEPGKMNGAAAGSAPAVDPLGLLAILTIGGFMMLLGFWWLTDSLVSYLFP